MTPDQKTKLALMCYPDPEGLHPNEKNWREFARFLASRIYWAEYGMDQGELNEIAKELENEMKNEHAQMSPAPL